MYVNLRKSFLDKTKDKAIEEAIAEMGKKEGADTLYYPEINEDKITAIEIEDTGITVDIENELGFFSIKIPVDTDILEQVLSVAIKRMNKIKAMLESLK